MKGKDSLYSIFHVLIYIFLKFCLLKLTSAADVKEGLSSIPLLHDNVQLFPCGQQPTNSDTFAMKVLQRLSVRRAELGGTARAGWPSPGHTWPVLLSHTRPQPPPSPCPAPCVPAAHSTHARNKARRSIYLLWIKQGVFVFYGKAFRPVAC